MKAGTAGGIEAIVKAINTHIDNVDVCEWGCSALWNVTEGSALLQKEACEKGSLEALLKVLKEHSDNEDLLGSCCAAIGTVLSSPETHTEYCTPEVIRSVEECYEKHKEKKTGWEV